MRIKSYFMDSVQEAIERARLELGPDAMLLNSKKTELDLRALGMYEVVFGVNSDGAAHSAVAPAEKALPEPSEMAAEKKRAIHAGGGISKGLSALLAAMPPELATGNESALSQPGDRSGELADLREQIETVKRSMDRQLREWTEHAAGTPAAEPEPAGAGRPRPEPEQFRRRLVTAGFSQELAVEIAAAVENQLAAGRSGDAAGEQRETTLRSELAGRFRVAPGLAMSEAGRRVLFAGPAGCGKTTSLIKLALRHSLAERVPLQILSLDTLRVGGWEQLAAYARIAGIPFDVIHNPAGLGQALAEYRAKKLILIDTPGFSPAEWRETPELADWVARESALEVQLVLPATLRLGVAQRALEQFAAFRPAKLLLTHLDEAEAPGAVLELAMRSGLPLSYLGIGQQIPEDIEEASRERLLEPFTAALVRATQMHPQVANAA